MRGKWLLAGGLLARLLLIGLALPLTHQVWFLPFLAAAPAHLLDPWGGFLAAGGNGAAFPYGLPYLLVFGPLTWIGGALAAAPGAHIGLGLTVLLLELALLRLLVVIAGPDAERTALFYWLSPVALYVGYWHGQLDVLPALLLVAALAALLHGRHGRSGAWLGAAVAAKFSMGLAAPFIALFYFGRARQQRLGRPALAMAVLALAVLLGPLFALPGFRTMVLLTPETAKSFSLAIDFSSSLRLYVLPLAYLALLYWAWRVRRLDFGLLWNFVGVAFMLLLLLTPASPGWALWAMPFVALGAARAGTTGRILFASFTLAFVVLHLTISSGAFLAGVDLSAPLAARLPERLPSLLLTLMLGAGGALTLQMARRGILGSAFYRASRKPFSIAISGDSGSGKDTLVDAIEAMFGTASTTRLSGDDYHSWDRNKPMWRAMTHLNPMANDLEGFGAHVAELANGRAVEARHYDHRTGRAGELQTVQPREILTVSGLHALWSPALNSQFDVRVFLDMDEGLRRFLKLRRDVLIRGHSAEKVVESIARRQPDRLAFIQPQADAADIVLRLEPRHPTAIADTALTLDATLLRLVARLTPGHAFDQPARLLTSLAGMQIIETTLPDGFTELLIEGEPAAADIAAVARRVAPDLAWFLAVEPDWLAGLSGVMQIIVLTEIDRSRRRRGLAA